MLSAEDLSNGTGRSVLHRAQRFGQLSPAVRRCPPRAAGHSRRCAGPVPPSMVAVGSFCVTLFWLRTVLAAGLPWTGVPPWLTKTWKPCSPMPLRTPAFRLLRPAYSLWESTLVPTKDPFAEHYSSVMDSSPFRSSSAGMLLVTRRSAMADEQR